MENRNFVAVSNMFLSDCDEKLTPDELSVYYVIRQHELKWFDCKSETTIKQIADKINLQKDVNKNMNKIKVALISLKQKGAVMYEGDELNNTSSLQLTFKNIEYYHKSTKCSIKGYEMIPFWVFEKARSSNELYALCLILKNKQGRIAYSTFANLLGVTDKTAKTLISNMVEDGLIQRFSGDYYRLEEGEVRQEINQYKVIEQKHTDVESLPAEPLVIEKKDAEKKPRKKSLTAKVTVESEDDGIEWGNWNDKAAKLNTNDIYLYLTQRELDENFKNRCEERMEILKKSGFKFERMFAEAKQIIFKEKNAAIEIEKLRERLKEEKIMREHIRIKMQERSERKVSQEKLDNSLLDWDDTEEDKLELRQGTVNHEEWLHSLEEKEASQL